ncbi:MAG: TfoX/Sxy family protein [Oscillospiraceae bacterium]|nr:TfoX/Sxy family protein [Oscillospiraceae bacterium]
MELKDLPNIGPVLAANLHKISVDTPEALKKMGAEEAWLAIRCQVDPGACLHQLQALAGAVAGIPKKELSLERKTQLKQFFDANQ